MTVNSNYGIPTSQHPFVVGNNGIIDKVWFRFLNSVYVTSGSGQATSTLTDVITQLSDLQNSGSGSGGTSPPAATTTAMSSVVSQISVMREISKQPPSQTTDLTAILKSLAALKAQIAALSATPATKKIYIELCFYLPGLVGGMSPIWLYEATKPLYLPKGLYASKFSSQVAATATVTLTIYKNTTSIGTLTIAASSITVTVAFSSAVTFKPGDVLSITGPSSPDPTFAGLTGSFSGYRY